MYAAKNTHLNFDSIELLNILLVFETKSLLAKIRQSFLSLG